MNRHELKEILDKFEKDVYAMTLSDEKDIDAHIRAHPSFNEQIDFDLIRDTVNKVKKLSVFLESE